MISNFRLGLNNILAFINFNFFYFVFNLIKKELPSNKSLLIINTGTLGDAIISSVLMEHFEKLNFNKAYFVIDHEYASLFTFKNSSIQIIPLNKKKYKWSYFYKYKFLKKLRELKCSDCYNMTSARGISSDELALLSGASNTFCFYSKWKSIKKIFDRIMDRKYTSILFPDILNEYEKHKLLIAELSGDETPLELTSTGINLECTSEFSFLNYKDYIVVAPFASDMIKSLGVKRYIDLCGKISLKCNIILIGSSKEQELLFNESTINSYKNILNLVGKVELKHIPYLIYNSRLFIGNDSGLSHLALKLGVPLIAIIGGGSYNRYFPYNRTNAHFLFEEMPCFGCEWKCHHQECYCLTRIPDEKILSIADELLKISKSAHETA